MRTAGGLLMALGVLVVLFAFAMDTTVYSSGTLIGGTYVGGGSTHNLGLLQQQMMVLHTGLAGFLAGAFLTGGAAANEGEGVRPLRRQWDDLREGETEEERDERVAGVERINQIFAGVAIAMILVALFLAQTS